MNKKCTFIIIIVHFLVIGVASFLVSSAFCTWSSCSFVVLGVVFSAIST